MFFLEIVFETNQKKKFFLLFLLKIIITNLMFSFIISIRQSFYRRIKSNETFLKKEMIQIFLSLV